MRLSAAYYKLARPNSCGEFYTVGRRLCLQTKIRLPTCSQISQVYSSVKLRCLDGLIWPKDDHKRLLRGGRDATGAQEKLSGQNALTVQNSHGHGRSHSCSRT